MSPRSDEYWSNRPIYTLVQEADIAADVFVADDELLVWVTDLLTGEPLADATVETFDGTFASTDEGGIVRIPLDTPVEGLTATIGDRSVVAPAPWFNAWDSSSRFDQDRWYIFDDRGIYRPGETVRDDGLIRELSGDDLQLATVDGPAVVRYTASTPRATRSAAGTDRPQRARRLQPHGSSCPRREPRSGLDRSDARRLGRATACATAATRSRSRSSGHPSSR